MFQAGVACHLSCGANNNNVSHFVHLYYVNDDHPAECFHNRGDSTANATIYSLCAGNNSGYIDGSDRNSLGVLVHGAVHYGPSQPRQPIAKFQASLRNAFHVSQVGIVRWSGENRCN